jgi:hypothetical protein
MFPALLLVLAYLASFWRAVAFSPGGDAAKERKSCSARHRAFAAEDFRRE